MKRIGLIVLLLLPIIGLSQNAKLTKVKLKQDKSALYYYNKDSVCIEDKKEVSKLLFGFHQFFKMVREDNFEGYLSCLTSKTLERIVPDKLDRKYKKFRGYNANLTGKIIVKSIQPGQKEYLDEEGIPVYTCTVYLPEGQEIIRRVGFDPLKRNRSEEAKNLLALLIAKENDEYKVVILW